MTNQTSSFITAFQVSYHAVIHMNSIKSNTCPAQGSSLPHSSIIGRTLQLHNGQVRMVGRIVDIDQCIREQNSRSYSLTLLPYGPTPFRQRFNIPSKHFKTTMFTIHFTSKFMLYFKQGNMYAELALNIVYNFQNTTANRTHN